MTVKKVVMAEQSVGVCRYVVRPGPRIRFAKTKEELDSTERDS